MATQIDIPYLKYKTLIKGLKLDKGTIARGKIQRLGKKDGFIHWRVILCEGKHHEVKRIFKTLGSVVIHLHRESFAGIKVDKIYPGKYRELKQDEINVLERLNELTKKN